MSIIHHIILSIILSRIDGSYQRENLAVRHPCYSINKRLEPYITWTEKLASSQYQGPKDACLTRNSQPVCCTTEILDSYANTLEIELKLLVDAELSRLSHVLLSSKQQLEDWLRDFLSESQHLTINALETLFGRQIYRLFVHSSVMNLFEILPKSRSTTDDVSKSTNDLFDQLIISLYRRFYLHNSTIELDQHFERCLITKSFDFNAFPNQRDLLYTLTSSSVSFEILRRMFVYIDADLERLKSSMDWSANFCTQRYARESLCPICLNSNVKDSFNQSLCSNACRFVLRSCFNQSSNPYVAFALIAKGYASIIKEIEQSVIELKLVERLGKLHIDLYDMIVNATINSHYSTQIQTHCPHPLRKIYSSLRSLKPIHNERRDLISNGNRSLHFIYHQLKSSIDNLYLRLSQQIISDICSNVNYAAKGNRCTQIDQQRSSSTTQWAFPSSLTLPNIRFNLQSTRDQLDDLMKKYSFIEQIILSLQPKKKYVLIEYLPDFDSYDNENDENPTNEQLLTFDDEQIFDNDGSLSEQLYKEIEQQTTTTMTMMMTRKTLSNRSTTISLNIFLFILTHFVQRKA